MKVAVVTRPDEKSPKVLALGLKAMLNKISVECDVFYEASTLIRMQPLGQKLKYPYSFIKRIYGKIRFLRTQRIFIHKLSKYDIIIISECTPNGFWRGYYAVEVLKAVLKKPVLFYEVYFLGNAPTQLERLRVEREPGIERYDWHLAVTDVTEIRSYPGNHWSRIGLNLENTGLKPIVKEKFLVLVDFEQPGYENYRKEQIEMLIELGIPYISLEGSYTMDEIREIYRKACLFIIQFPEAFGLPIAECLSCGAYVMTPSSSWPMSWRLDENPEVHCDGVLPECFKVYKSNEEFKKNLSHLELTYNLHDSPYRVFSSFISHYPHYYFGDLASLKMTMSQFPSSQQRN